MNETINIVRLRQPDEIDDPLTDVLGSGARNLLAQAIEIEAEAFLAEMKDLTLPDGRKRLVRHGRGPERMIQTGILARSAGGMSQGAKPIASFTGSRCHTDGVLRRNGRVIPKWPVLNQHPRCHQRCQMTPQRHSSLQDSVSIQLF